MKRKFITYLRTNSRKGNLLYLTIGAHTLRYFLLLKEFELFELELITLKSSKIDILIEIILSQIK